MYGIALLVIVFLLGVAPALLGPRTRAGRRMVTGFPFDPFDPQRMR
jgi:hypothetical protein